MNRNYILAIIILILFIASFGIIQLSYTNLLIWTLAVLFYFNYQKILIMISNIQNLQYILYAIGFMLFFYIFGYGGYYVYKNKQEINKDWPKYKCQPYILPFAGTLVGPDDVNPGENFWDCMWNMNKSFFNILIAPFLQMIKQITRILGGLTKDVQNVRLLLVYMRDSLKELAQGVYQKLWDSYARIRNIFLIIMNVFNKLFKVFDDLFCLGKHAIYTFMWMWNEQPGKIMRFFMPGPYCFDYFTPINTKRGIINMGDAKVGDIIIDEYGNKHKILEFMEFDSENVDMYKLFGITVSGLHPVKYQNTWIRVKDIPEAKLIQNYLEKRIYCFKTDTGIIPVRNIYFTDYHELHSTQLYQEIFDNILESINNNKKSNKNSNRKSKNLNSKNSYKFKMKSFESWGFTKDTKIQMFDNQYRNIQDINVGDNTYFGKVIGKIVIDTTINKPKLFDINGDKTTQYNIIRDGQTWKVVQSISDVENNEIINNENKLYHLVISTNIIKTENNIFRDFIFTNNEEVNEEIDEITLKLLNNL